MRHDRQIAQSSRHCWLKFKQALAYIASGLSKCWAQVRTYSTAIRQKCSLSVWLAIATSVIIGAVGLRYAYVQQILAYRSLTLAEWTAAKDFRELCLQNVQAVPQNTSCEAILKKPLPEPPSVSFERRKRSWICEGNLNVALQDSMATYKYLYPDAVRLLHAWHAPASNAHLLLDHWVVSLILGSLLFRHRRKLLRYIFGSWWSVSVTQPHGAQHPSILLSYRGRCSPSYDYASPASTSIDSSSTKNLRRRHVDRKPQNSSTIWKAAAKGSIEEVERHLENGIDVNVHSTADGTPLARAAYNGRTEVIQLLLSKGADPRRKHGQYKETALQAASENGHEDVVCLLLDHGADMNSEIGGLRPICAAAWSGQSNVVQMLIYRGAQKDLVKGLSTNGILLAADHANRVIIGCILKFDVERASEMLLPQSGELGLWSTGHQPSVDRQNCLETRRVLDDAEKDVGHLDFFNDVCDVAKEASNCWQLCFEDRLKMLVGRDRGPRLRRLMLEAMIC